MDFNAKKRIGTDFSVVYICHTVYHLYISLIRSFYLGERNVDLILMDAIPDVDLFADRIKKEGVFQNVFILGKKRPFASSDYIKAIFDCAIHRCKYKKKLDFLSTYEKIYLFNDMTEIGCYLTQMGIPFHLLEDGLDCYKVMNQDLVAQARKRTGLARHLCNIFDVPYRIGTSKMCIDLEINDDLGLKTSVPVPIRCLPRKLFTSSLTSANLDVLRSVFNIPDTSTLEGGVLILTSPLFDEGYEQSDSLEFYSRLLKVFKGRNCFIKPHPRDPVDYSEIIEKKRIIDKKVPIELFSLDSDLHMFAVVTYNSTSIGSISFVEKKFVTKAGFDIEGAKNLQMHPRRGNSKKDRRKGVLRRSVK